MYRSLNTQEVNVGALQMKNDIKWLQYETVSWDKARAEQQRVNWNGLHVGLVDLFFSVYWFKKFWAIKTLIILNIQGATLR